MKYNSAIQRNEVSIHTTIWMNLVNIILSERSQLLISWIITIINTVPSIELFTSELCFYKWSLYLFKFSNNVVNTIFKTENICLDQFRLLLWHR